MLNGEKQASEIRCNFDSLRKMDKISVLIEGKILTRSKDLARQQQKSVVDQELISQAFADVIAELGQDPSKVDLPELSPTQNDSYRK